MRRVAGQGGDFQCRPGASLGSVFESHGTAVEGGDFAHEAKTEAAALVTGLRARE